MGEIPAGWRQEKALREQKSLSSVLKVGFVGRRVARKAQAGDNLGNVWGAEWRGEEFGLAHV